VDRDVQAVLVLGRRLQLDRRRQLDEPESGDAPERQLQETGVQHVSLVQEHLVAQETIASADVALEEDPTDVVDAGTR
jgi:hypothetical protein